MKRWPKLKCCPIINNSMKIYQVGGAVRDSLLGLPVQDVDYVVVGATPEQMIEAGYRPVGKDFPVFLHPTSNAEYALARTERKNAPGYHGFVFHCAADVTLEQDLLRRDLTINAMAAAPDIDVRQHRTAIIDPYNGQQDLRNRVFRHVSAAFAEDPVRILRLARFAARFNTFSVAPETMKLMRSMVDAGEVDALVAERVWQELARGLMEQQPSRMLQVLHDCGALARIAPELVWSNPQETPPALAVLDYAAQQGSSMAVRWAALLTAALQRSPDQGSVVQLCTRLRVPIEARDIAVATFRESTAIANLASLDAQSVLRLLERCDALRRSSRFDEIIEAERCVRGLPQSEFVQRTLLQRALAAVQAVPAGEIAQQFPGQPAQIAKQISSARVVAIQAVLEQFQQPRP
jgi:tRNA nucleotidyltransferase (CCA-adding enzyme)